MRSIIFAVIASFLFIIAVEYGYRYTGGLPSVTPGKTLLDFQWRIKQTKADKVIYFIGDSRVDWGFGDRLFTKQITKIHGLKIKAVNAGFASGSVETITKYVLSNSPNTKPGVLVINFTPTSFCYFKTSPGKPIVNLKRQDILDDRITNNLTNMLFSYGRKPKSLFLHFKSYKENGYIKRSGWYSRRIFPDGFAFAEKRYNNGSEVVRDDFYYRRVFNKMRRHIGYYNKRMNKANSVILEAQSLGWMVILIRFPVGDSIMKLEKKLPKFFQPERIASEILSPFIDYTNDPRTSQLGGDGSHLVPESARKVTTMLVKDIYEFLSTGKDTDVMIRRATIDDKDGIWNVHTSWISELCKTHYNKREIRAWIASLKKEDYDEFITNREIFVAELRGIIVGFGQLNLQTGDIEALYISPPALGRCIASKILKVLEKAAIRNNVCSVTVSATLNSIGFYKQAGYTQRETFKHNLPGGVQLESVSMNKTLPKIEKIS